MGFLKNIQNCAIIDPMTEATANGPLCCDTCTCTVSHSSKPPVDTISSADKAE
jgi:hypothetical protein